MKNLKWFKQSKIIFCFLITVACTGIVSYVFTRKSTIEEIGLVSTNYLTVYEQPVKVDNFVNRYSFFLDDEKAEYIEAITQAKQENVLNITVGRNKEKFTLRIFLLSKSITSFVFKNCIDELIFS